MELRGTGVSPGVAVGKALVVRRESAPAFRLFLPPEEVEREVQRLTRAVEASRGQLRAIKARLSNDLGMPHAYIFEAQLLMLDDPLLLDRSVALVREENVNAEWALRTVSEQLRGLFDEFTDQYLRERSTDLDDVLGRIQLNLAGEKDAPSLSRLPGPCVLVAEDLTPSEAADLDWDRVLAVVTDAGSATYHTAILARSLGIPAVAGLKDASRRVPPGALLIVDGARGRVVVEPTGPVLADYRAVQERERSEEERLQGTRALPAITLDGVRVRLQANVEFPEETETALAYGAEGIGLFRSEYLLGRGRDWPPEEKQLEVYCGLLAKMHPHPVTVRTWDVGPSGLVPGLSGENPALGERAIRLARRFPEPFRVQLRALLRAAAHGPLRILVPFVTGPADVQVARELLEETRAGLRRDGVEFRADVPLGLNVEVPAAAATADLLAAEADFLSIGSNDLIQYLLAVDRADPAVAGHYQPLHPAVLRVIHSVVEAARARHVPVALCGEMAADPLTALVLVGLGLRELSMTPGAVPRVKASLRAASVERAGAIARACLGLRSSAEIEGVVRSGLAEALSPGAEGEPAGEPVPGTAGPAPDRAAAGQREERGE